MSKILGCCKLVLLVVQGLFMFGLFCFRLPFIISKETSDYEQVISEEVQTMKVRSYQLSTLSSWSVSSFLPVAQEGWNNMMIVSLVDS
jgi:hypothetical protein